MLTDPSYDYPRESHPLRVVAALESRRGLIVWLTGLSGAGKTTIAREVAAVLGRRHVPVEVLDGDTVRNALSKDLGFSREDRNANVRRVAFVADLLSRHGVVVLVAMISPYRDARSEVRSSTGRFIEVYVNAPLEVCELRDPKGLYQKARQGVLRSFTGISDPYEPPMAPDVECRTDLQSPAKSARLVLEAIARERSDYKRLIKLAT